MEQSEDSKQNTEIEEVQKRDEELLNVLADSYYTKPETTRYLLVENIAIKALLFDKGLVTIEEYQKYIDQAQVLIEEKVKHQIEEWRKNNPKESVLFDILSRKK